MIAYRAATAAVNTHCCSDWPSNTQLAGCENSNHAFIRLTQRNPSLHRPPFHLLTDKAYAQTGFLSSCGETEQYCGYAKEIGAWFKRLCPRRRLFGREQDSEAWEGEAAAAPCSWPAPACSSVDSSTGARCGRAEHACSAQPIGPPPGLCSDKSGTRLKSQHSQLLPCIVCFTAQKALQQAANASISAIQLL